MHCGLTGNLPAEWRSLTSLNTIYLNDNSFVGSIPSEWADIMPLETLALERNYLRGAMPDFVANVSVICNLEQQSDDSNWWIFWFCFVLEKKKKEESIFLNFQLLCYVLVSFDNCVPPGAFDVACCESFDRECAILPTPPPITETTEADPLPSTYMPTPAPTPGTTQKTTNTQSNMVCFSVLFQFQKVF